MPEKTEKSQQFVHVRKNYMSEKVKKKNKEKKKERKKTEEVSYSR